MIPDPTDPTGKRSIDSGRKILGHVSTFSGAYMNPGPGHDEREIVTNAANITNPNEDDERAKNNSRRYDRA
jgi:hypothetical protein